MANTFPADGNVGIGTITPPDLLTIDTGTGNTVPARERISGRSPNLGFGSAALGYCGGETFIGLVTSAGEFATGSNVGDSFFIHDSNDQRMFIGRSAGNIPVLTVKNSTGNVGVGTNDPAGRIVAAAPITSGLGAVQLQGIAAAAGTHTLALGYGGTWNGYDMKESGYVQGEWQGMGYYPLRLQPVSGVVYIGRREGGPFPPDINEDGVQSIHRFQVIQEINDVSNKPGNKFHIMSSFEMVSAIPAGPGNDTGCGRFFATQIGRSEIEGGAAWIRALEAQAIRRIGAANNRTWGLEVGCHNAQRGESPHTSVGIYLHASNPALIQGTGKRCNTAVLIDNRPEDDGHGWDRFILCRQGSLSTTATNKFEVDRFGNVIAEGSLSGNGDIFGGGNLTIGINAEIYGYTLSTQFITYSSSDLKENIARVEDHEAIGLLAGLTPVKYNLKNKSGRQLMGFVLEDVPPAFAVDAKGVDVMAVVATLTGVVRSQRKALEQLRARVDQLESRGPIN